MCTVKNIVICELQPRTFLELPAMFRVKGRVRHVHSCAGFMNFIDNLNGYEIS